MRCRFLSVAILSAILVGLGVFGYASPPDPVWLGGLYDAADYDDVVMAATSMDSSAESAPPLTIKPFPIVVRFVLHGDPTAADATLPGFRTRAPPIS